MIMEIKTGAAYVRVSTDGQLDLSLDAQKREILKYAKVNLFLPRRLEFPGRKPTVAQNFSE